MVAELGAPVAIRWGSRDPEAPLIVILESRGEDLANFARYLPDGAAYASIRVQLAPPAEQGPQFAAFCGWLENLSARQVPVVLAGAGGWPECRFF